MDRDREREGESNPFAPPATQDLDAGASSAASGAVLSEDSLRELADTEPWLRWLWRFLVLSMVVGVLSMAASLARHRTRTEAISSSGVLLIVTAFTVPFVVLLRRYAAASSRLARGERDAGQVLELQSRYLKLSAVVTLVSIGLVVVGFIVTFAVLNSQRGAG